MHALVCIMILRGTSPHRQYKLYASNLEIHVEAQDLYCHGNILLQKPILCLQQKVSCTLQPSQKLKNYRQTTENGVGAQLSGGRFGHLTAELRAFENDCIGNLLFDHIYLILPFLASTCRHRPIIVKSKSTGRSLFVIITSTAT